MSRWIERRSLEVLGISSEAEDFCGEWTPFASQSLQNLLIKEYTLNRIRDPIII